jgi:hypothetical protein
MKTGYGRGYYGEGQLVQSPARPRSSWTKWALAGGVVAAGAVIWFMWPRKSEFGIGGEDPRPSPLPPASASAPSVQFSVQLAPPSQPQLMADPRFFPGCAARDFSHGPERRGGYAPDGRGPLYGAEGQGFVHPPEGRGSFYGAEGQGPSYREGQRHPYRGDFSHGAEGQEFACGTGRGSSYGEGRGSPYGGGGRGVPHGRGRSSSYGEGRGHSQGGHESQGHRQGGYEGQGHRGPHPTHLSHRTGP